jgi:hypothetical protein
MIVLYLLRICLVIKVLILFFCEQYLYSQEILNEGVRLPGSNKRGIEIERDV